MTERAAAPASLLFRVLLPDGSTTAHGLLDGASAASVGLLAARPCPPGPAVLMPLPPHPLAGRLFPFTVERSVALPGGCASVAGTFNPALSDAEALALAEAPRGPSPIFSLAGGRAAPDTPRTPTNAARLGGSTMSPDTPPRPALPPGDYEVTRKALAGLWTYRLQPLAGEALSRAPDAAVELPAGPDPYRAVFARASPHLAAGRVVVRLDVRRALLWFLPGAGA